MKVLGLDYKEIYNIVEQKAKFQKVLVVYDDEFSNFDLVEIYNTIKEICIYNQKEVSCVDEEINNGYRAIIYACSPNNFLKLKIDKREFINICCVKDNIFLPYCVNFDNKLMTKNLYILTLKDCVDVSLYTSISFNKFYHYLTSVLNCENHNPEFICENIQVSNLSKSAEVINNINTDFEFVDMDILSNSNIDYKDLNLVHVLLIDAFLLLITNLKNKTLTIVDIYRNCKEEYALIDKFYAMLDNEMFYTMINLNYNSLVNVCIKVKEQILQNLIIYNVADDKMQNIMTELKTYSKYCNNYLGYLFLYDFFK